MADINIDEWINVLLSRKKSLKEDPQHFKRDLDYLVAEIKKQPEDRQEFLLKKYHPFQELISRDIKRFKLSDYLVEIYNSKELHFEPCIVQGKLMHYSVDRSNFGTYELDVVLQDSDFKDTTFKFLTGKVFKGGLQNYFDYCLQPEIGKYAQYEVVSYKGGICDGIPIGETFSERFKSRFSGKTYHHFLHGLEIDGKILDFQKDMKI